jgi:DNA topoisomerase-1
MNIVVVESPAKAKTINKYLGPGYEVLASFGHIRDLPAKDGSVDPDANFKMIWEVDERAQKRINDIARAVKSADKLILATDPDREGEAISWHVLEVLREKNALKDQQIERVVFNAITKQAVSEAMKNPRKIDLALVDAYLARRALDYLVGFTLSPVLWRKLPGARSAGRVQSVALRLVCDRELEIEKFITREYWSLVATLATPRNDTFEARLVGADGKKIQRLDIGTGQEAEDFKKALETAAFKVASVEAKPARRSQPKAWLCPRAYDADRSALIRRHRHRRRDGRSHYLYANRRHRHGAGSHLGHPFDDRQELRQGLCAGRAAPLSEQIKECARSA